MKRQDFQRLADARLADAKLMFSDERFDTAYYLAGYAVECGLKACAAKLTIFEFQRDKKPLDLVYTHNLSTLIDSAGLKGEFDLEYGSNKSFEDNWEVVKLWTADSRLRLSERTECPRIDRCDRGSRERGTAMDTPTLVDAQKDAGAALLRALDSAGFPVEGAFWYQADETDEWRLAIVTPLLESEGPRATYARLRDVLASHPEIDLTTASIYLFLERDPLYQRLRRSAKTARFAVERHYVMATGEAGGSAMIYRSS